MCHSQNHGIFKIMIDFNWQIKSLESDGLEGLTLDKVYIDGPCDLLIRILTYTFLAIYVYLKCNGLLKLTIKKQVH